MKNFTRISCLLALLLGASIAHSEDNKHKLAQEYLVLSKTKETIEQTIDTYANQLSARDSKLEVDKFREFLVSVVGWEVIEVPTIKLVTSQFSEQELQDIVAFYKTPSGASLANKSPEISAELSSIIAKNIQQALSQTAK